MSDRERQIYHFTCMWKLKKQPTNQPKRDLQYRHQTHGCQRGRRWEMGKMKGIKRYKLNSYKINHGDEKYSVGNVVSNSVW